MVKVYESWGNHGLDSLDGLNSGLQFGSRRNYGFLFWEDFNRVETKSTNCTAQAAQGRVRNEDITTESPEVLPIRLIATGHVSNNKNDLVGGFKQPCRPKLTSSAAVLNRTWVWYRFTGRLPCHVSPWILLAFQMVND